MINNRKADDNSITNNQFVSGQNFAQFLQKFNAALKVISAVIENIDEEYRVNKMHNPIHHIESRIKSIDSLSGKLAKKGLEQDLSVARREVTDIAGIRVVCKYIDDVYLVASKLTSYYEGSILKVRDYIKSPKINGYRSYHIVVNVPIYINGITECYPVEVQLRTIAMDMWASLEHELRYKGEGCEDLATRDKLRICSLTMKLVDQSMQEIFRDIRG